MTHANEPTTRDQAAAAELTRRQFMGVAGASLAGGVLAISGGAAGGAGAYGANTTGTAGSTTMPTTMKSADEDGPVYEGPYFDGHQHYSQAYLDDILLSWKDGNVQGGINLCGGELHFGYHYHGDYAEMLKIVKAKKMDNFVQFYWPIWANFLIDGPKFVEELCRDMKRFADLGCRGMKVWKDFGMYFMREDGTPVTMDDPGLNPVWKTAAEIGWTIALHQADPTSNWTPGKKYFPATTLTREEIYVRRDKVIAAHPEIKFILCHAGNNLESYKRFAEVLDRFPHVNSDVATSWEKWSTEDEFYAFMTKYADRLYDGTDLRMPEERVPDRPWNLQNVWLPHRRALARWEKRVGREVVQKLAWGNGARDFLAK